MKAIPWLINWSIAVCLMLVVMHLQNSERQYNPCHFASIDGCAHVTIWENRNGN